jgi:hypothetical protein
MAPGKSRTAAGCHAAASCPRVTAPFKPTQIIPAALAAVVDDLPYWFVIGGHAVRCFCPYRPSIDVDFGVGNARGLRDLLAQLARSGRSEILERAPDTVHLRWNGLDVSVFVLPVLEDFIEDRHLTITGVLATKLHAILDRGTRRDFFDLYVTLQGQRLGVVECLRAIRDVYRQDVNDGLLLRALTYFDDADREAPLPGEGTRDWKTVKNFFLTAVGALLVPPMTPLRIQQRVVDVASRPPKRSARRKRT